MEYKEKIKKEGEFWDLEAEELAGKGFDFKNRKNFRTEKPVSIWEDSYLEDMVRGPYKDKMIRLAVASKGPSLELGCGTGWLSREIASCGISVEGYDVAKKNIELAQKYSQDMPHAHFEIKDLNKAEFPENKFGAVIVWDSLHHLAELDYICQEMKKTLRPGGFFLVWDHIELRGFRGALSKMLGLFFYLTLPTEEKIGEKLRYTYRKLTGKHQGEESPFEDVSSDTLEETLEKNFKVQHKSYPITFVKFFLARIRTSIPFYKTIVRALVALDKILGKIGILKGEYIFMILVNEK